MTYPAVPVSVPAPSIEGSMMLQMQAQSAYDDVKKSTGIAYAFWFFLGGFGAHRFYLGQVGLGLAMMFTFGGLGIWTLIDAFLLVGEVRQANARKKFEIFSRAGLPTPLA
jgi:TM2 domain-containing membrane protein YozV